TILSEKESIPSFPCETSTAYRICRWFFLLRNYFERIIEAMKLIYKQDLELLEMLEKLSSLNPATLPSGWLEILVRIIVNSGRWKQTRSA
ncbi:MAG: hypothetical protein J6P40_05725, partial [Oscillospiraceae bacterium]|nr:hypothetical protein [Oscillospiraceae bacterium]